MVETVETSQMDQMDPWLASLLRAREQRGIQAIDPAAKQRFVKVRRTIMGINELVASGEPPEAILAKVKTINPELLGFALEGVGMALAKQDISARFTDFNQVEAFVANTSTTYQLMVFLGVGLLLATDRLPLKSYLAPYLEPFNALRVWSIVDGYGFQCGMLHWENYLQGQPKSENLCDFTNRVFDQGLGRSIWLIDAGDVTHVQRTIGTFSPSRQPDLWSGIGYVCSSVGGAQRETLEALAAAAGVYLPALAQGSASAARFRKLLGTPAVHVEMAAQILSELVAAKSESQTPSIGSIPAQGLWKNYRSYLICNL